MLTVLNPRDRAQPFPAVELALTEPNGLLAVGGCLSPVRLVNAYRQGVFPWYSEGEPILWWSPDPRLILHPEGFHRSRRLRRTLRREGWRFSFDRSFEAVVQACSEPRRYAAGTWLNVDMKRAYRDLHRLGIAHSFEVWTGSQLIGGVYGVTIGQVFFGESMFHRAANASKAALAFACACLAYWRYEVIDCQVHTPHLASLGAVEIPRQQFTAMLRKYCDRRVGSEAWVSGPAAWL